MTFPTNTAAYVDTPWTDPATGTQWIYDQTIPAWARYRVASTGGVSSFNDLTDVPAALTSQQAAATPSIRKIGTGATDAAAGDHSHSSLTVAINESVTFTGGVSGLVNIFADNVDGSWDVQLQNKSGTFAYLDDLGGTSNALVFAPSSDEAVSILSVGGIATFTFGTNAKAAFLAAVGAMASTGGTMTNGTISGTVTFGAGGQAGMFAALGTGTPSSTTYLRGDGTWATAGGFSGTSNRITVAGTADSNLETSLATSGTNATVNIVSLGVPSAVGSTNVALLLTPKGTGAIIAGSLPDGSAVGGNARGAGAVDLQLTRNNAAQVASGQGAFVAGMYSRAAGTTAPIALGYDCSASGSGAPVAMGSSCTASGQWSVAIGSSCTASGQGSVAIGNNVTSSASMTNGAGQYALSDRYGMSATAAGRFSATGDAQRADFVLRCKTTTNAAVEMALDGGTTYLTIPSGKIIAMTINVSGVKSDGSAVAHYLRQYAVKNVGGTSSEVYAAVAIGTDNAAGTSLAISINNTGDYVSIQPTGITGETWRWVAHVESVEIAYGT